MRKAFNLMDTPFALYIHIPFCATKCYYCAFNTDSFHKGQAQAYLQALRTEMELYAPGVPPLKTIFLGRRHAFDPFRRIFNSVVYGYLVFLSGGS